MGIGTKLLFIIAFMLIFSLSTPAVFGGVKGGGGGIGGGSGSDGEDSAPTLGVDRHGKKFIDNGVTINDKHKIDVKYFSQKLDEPISIEINKPVIIDFKIYENVRFDNVEYFSFGLIYKEKSYVGSKIIDEIRSTIELRRAFDGTYSVNVRDPADYIDIENVETRKIDNNILGVTVSFIPLKTTDGAISAETMTYDYRRNFSKNTFNNLLTITDTQSKYTTIAFAGVISDKPSVPILSDRIKVQFPWIPEDDEFYSTLADSPGYYFLPEIDNEVFVGFEHGDITLPVVLGSLWNGKDKIPPQFVGSSTEKTFDLKNLKSKSGELFLIEDDKTIKLNEPKEVSDLLDSKVIIAQDQEIAYRALTSGNFVFLSFDPSLISSIVDDSDGELGPDDLMALFMMLSLTDPNNSDETHKALYEMASELRKQGIQEAQQKAKLAEQMARSAQLWAEWAKLNPLLALFWIMSQAPTDDFNFKQLSTEPQDKIQDLQQQQLTLPVTENLPPQIVSVELNPYSPTVGEAFEINFEFFDDLFSPPSLDTKFSILEESSHGIVNILEMEPSYNQGIGNFHALLECNQEGKVMTSFSVSDGSNPSTLMLNISCSGERLLGHAGIIASASPDIQQEQSFAISVENNLPGVPESVEFALVEPGVLEFLPLAIASTETVPEKLDTKIAEVGPVTFSVLGSKDDTKKVWDLFDRTGEGNPLRGSITIAVIDTKETYKSILEIDLHDCTLQSYSPFGSLNVDDPTTLNFEFTVIPARIEFKAA